MPRVPQVAVVLENFSALTERREEDERLKHDVGIGLVGDDHLHEYQQMWSEYDPDGEQYIHIKQLEELVQRLPAPLGERPMGAPPPPPVLVKKSHVIKLGGLTRATRVHFGDSLKQLIRLSFREGLRVELPTSVVSMPEDSLTARDMQEDEIVDLDAAATWHAPAGFIAPERLPPPGGFEVATAEPEGGATPKSRRIANANSPPAVQTSPEGLRSYDLSQCGVSATEAERTSWDVLSSAGMSMGFEVKPPVTRGSPPLGAATPARGAFRAKASPGSARASPPHGTRGGQTATRSPPTAQRATPGANSAAAPPNGVSPPIRTGLSAPKSARSGGGARTPTASGRASSRAGAVSARGQPTVTPSGQPTVTPTTWRGDARSEVICSMDRMRAGLHPGPGAYPSDTGGASITNGDSVWTSAREDGSWSETEAVKAQANGTDSVTAPASASTKRLPATVRMQPYSPRSSPPLFKVKSNGAVYVYKGEQVQY